MRATSILMFGVLLAGCGDAVVGSWVPDGQTIPVLEFRKDGSVHMTAGGAGGISGTWERVDSGMIRMHFDTPRLGQITGDMNYEGNVRVSIEGDRMTLQSGEGNSPRSVTFVRQPQ